MSSSGPRKPPDYSAKTAVKTVGLMTAAGLLLIGCIAGVASLASGSEDQPGAEVSTSPAPTGRYNEPATPAATAVVVTPAASPTPSPSTVPPVSPKPPAVRKPPAAPKTTRPPAPPPPEEDEPDEEYYANCTEARNAGAAPLYRGDPGYRKALDRDGDGVACES